MAVYQSRRGACFTLLPPFLLPFALFALTHISLPTLLLLLPSCFVQERSETQFKHNLSCLFAATAAYAGFAAIRGWLFSLVNTNLLQRLRSQLFGRLISQPVAFFDTTETAQLTSRLAADCSVISRLFATSINVALRNALQVVSQTCEAGVVTGRTHSRS
jgi:ABC-type multidrug transport system fused ATPase/permease subunit